MTLLTMHKSLFVLFLLPLSLLTTSLSAWGSSGERYALIIGNADYQVGPLKNPVNDAKALASSLGRLGFNVTLLTNVDRREMQQAIRAYTKSLKADDINLFYFAGHGIQVDSRNYLIPLSAEIESDTDIEYESIELSYVLDSFKQAKNRQNIILLDACRNNPYKAEARGLRRGLAQTDGPKGTFIAYATAPGAVALDGLGNNGVFTGALLEVIEQQGLSLEQVFKKTLASVNKETRGKQVPWISSSFYEDFYFAGKPTSTTPVPSTNLSASTSDESTSHVSSSEFNSANSVQSVASQNSNNTALTMRSNIYFDEVVINGRSYGTTPFSLDLAHGRYDVSVEREGFKTWQRSINLTESERVVWAQMQRKIQMVTYKNGDRFIGTLVNKKKSGKGLYIYSSQGSNAGDRYYGQYEKGVRQGFGTFITAEGERYVGDFEKGKRNGIGTLNYTNGDQYYGDFKNGQRTGSGSLLYRSGDSYYGDFVKGVRSGNGVYTFADGREYQGAFVQGARHGVAICRSATQKETACQYDNGKRISIQ